MYSSKNNMDFMSEMKRLFPKTSENESQQQQIFNNNMRPFTAFNSPFHPTIGNQSSSSADSTSPESYPDITMPRCDTPSFTMPSCDTSSFTMPRCDTPSFTMPRCDTPSYYRRQRPIVGRKIIPYEPRIVESPRFGSDFGVQNWNLTPAEESLYSLTPPNYPERYTQNEYELFPADKKTDFQTPVKSSPRPIENTNISPTSSNYSPSFSNYSPSLSNYSPSLNYGKGNSPSTSYGNEISPAITYGNEISPARTYGNEISPTRTYGNEISPAITYGNFFNISQTNFHQVKDPKMNNQQNFTLLPFQQRSLQLSETPKSGKICTFCKKNGERPAIYMGHCLKERVNNKTVVQCPILRKFVCSTCGATGENAHTNTYCPTQRSLNNGTPLQSTTIILKNTRVKSNGRRRY